MTDPAAAWVTRFRAALEAVGLTSAKKVAARISVSERQVARWYAEEDIPNPENAERLAELSDALRDLMAEIPREELRRLDLGRRVAAVEAELADLRQRVTGQVSPSAPQAPQAKRPSPPNTEQDHAQGP